MKAMIFAAGMGKRLGDITGATTKALIEIKGKSMLQHAVEKVTSHGFNDIIVNVHHFADLVEKEIDNLKTIGYKISVSDERDKLLETGGGLYKARWFFDNNPFLIYNADIISDIDLGNLYRFHNGMKAFVTLAARIRKGNRHLLVDENGKVRGWRNIATGEEILALPPEGILYEVGFSGIHIVNPEIFNFMNEGVYSLTPLYLELAATHRIMTFRHDEGYWWDIGTPENLEDVRKYYR